MANFNDDPPIQMTPKRKRDAEERAATQVAEDDKKKAKKEKVKTEYTIDEAREFLSRPNRGSLLRYPKFKIYCDIDEIALAAVSSQGAALKYVSPRLKGDEKVVSAALQSNQGSGQYLADAADKFKADRGMVELAMKHSASAGSALQYASNDIRGDAEFLEKAINIYGGKVFLHAADDLKRNEELLFKAIEAGLSYEHFKETGVLQESLNRLPIMVALVHQNADALELARQTTSGAWAANSDEIVLAAVQSDGMALQFASPKLQADRSIVLAAVQRDDGIGS